MRKIMPSAIALAAMLVAILHAAPALALNAKSYVSSFGNDANSCADVSNTCATFSSALAKTAAGGEISVVNTGNYGPLGIDKSVNITNDGAGEASILALNGVNGILFNAGAGDVLSLRGLVIDGQGTGSTGISIGQASAVHIQNCVIRNFRGFGIVFYSNGNTQLFVSDTIIFNNGSTARTGGIYILLFHAASANAVLDRVHLENNVRGLWVDGTDSTGNGAHVVIRDSVVAGNAADGILATSAPGQAPAFIVVEHTAAVNNAGTGIRADGPRATMLLNDNTIARNGVGIGAVNGGQLISYGNNKVNNNLGADGAPTGNYSPL
jgi:hypothetical protein